MSWIDNLRGRQPSGAVAALASALLFGVTTPVAKQLLADTGPLLIAGLLYAGSGIGLSLLRLVQDRRHEAAPLVKTDWLWLAATTAAGGIVAPALLMAGLAHVDASVASLLLNLEVVFTAILAWLVFREPTSGRVVLGLVAIFVGGGVLVWPDRLMVGGQFVWLLAIAGACLGWGLDNNLTRKISTSDARVIAGIKGLVAGVTNVGLAMAFGMTLPAFGRVLSTLLLGFLGYGLSLVLFIYALRNLGTVRTSAYFATAPFIGTGVAIVLYGQPGGPMFWAAAVCMAVGVWLHVTEHHEHDHVHEPLTHTHSHTHDNHHQHEHGPEWDGAAPHVHEHHHAPVRHRHSHFPDIHHQHTH